MSLADTPAPARQRNTRRAGRAPQAGRKDAMAIPLSGSGNGHAGAEPLVEKAGRSHAPSARTATPEALPAHVPAYGEKPEVIEPGRALALADFSPPAATAGEKFLRFAYRMGVRPSAIPGFGKAEKPRLLATVESALIGNRAAGMALRAGHFLVGGVKAPITRMNFGQGARLTPIFERTVHGFTWLTDLSASGAREQCTGVAERILGNWLSANPRPVSGAKAGAAWKVENAGWRLLNWLVHAPILFAGPDRALRSRALGHATETARWLDRHVGKAEDRLGELAGWTAIVAAGLLLPDGKARRLYGEAGLVRCLGDLVGDDGGVLSRSPDGQMDAIALLTQLSACYRAVREDPPEQLTAMLAMLVPPLLALTHRDGSLGSWQGSGAVNADAVARLVAASGVRTRPLRDVRQWGYQRVTGGGSVLQFDAAPPPLARHARHGCASTLAFEFSHQGQRIFVNCGGSALAGGQTPQRIEQGLRATAAHTTLVLDDANSTAVMMHGRLGNGVNEVEVDRRSIMSDGGGATRLEASHDGYAQRYGLTHRRILIMRDDGTQLRGEDLLIPSGRKGKRGKIGFAIRFHVGRGVELRLTDDGKGAGLALSDGSFWQFRLAEGTLAVEESMWVDGSGRPHPVEQLVVQGLVSRGGGNFSWLLKKMG